MEKRFQNIIKSDKDLVRYCVNPFCDYEVKGAPAREKACPRCGMLLSIIK